MGLAVALGGCGDDSAERVGAGSSDPTPGTGASTTTSASPAPGPAPIEVALPVGWSQVEGTEADLAEAGAGARSRGAPATSSYLDVASQLARVEGPHPFAAVNRRGEGMVVVRALTDDDPLDEVVAARAAEARRQGATTEPRRVTVDGVAASRIDAAAADPALDLVTVDLYVDAGRQVRFVDLFGSRAVVDDLIAGMDVAG